MEVLKKGSGWSLEETCTGKGNGNGGCGSLLKVEEGDLFFTRSSSYDGSSESYITFQCPVCRKYTDLDKSNVPAQIQKTLKLKYID